MPTTKRNKKKSGADDATPNPLAAGEEALLDAGEEAAATAMEAAAAAEAAESAIGNVLDDVGVDVLTNHEGEDTNDVEMAQAAAFAAAAVQAADGMAVVVDQALLATAAAAAASQVAEVLTADQQTTADNNNLPPPLPNAPVVHSDDCDHNYKLPSHLDPNVRQERRRVGRPTTKVRHSPTMSDEARKEYNAHRRELYRKQGEASRKRRRERERERYHSLEGDEKKRRNEHRARLERERYQKLSKEDLEKRNDKRRERAKQRKLKQSKERGLEVESVPTIPPAAAAAEETTAVPSLPDVGMNDADASAEVADQVIAGIEADGEVMTDEAAATVHI